MQLFKSPFDIFHQVNERLCQLEVHLHNCLYRSWIFAATSNLIPLVNAITGVVMVPKNSLRFIGDVNLPVPSDSYDIIRGMHPFVLTG